MDDKYPKFQWSKFKGASREEQYVIRANDLEELFGAIESLKERLEDTKTIDDTLDEAADATHVCKVCGKQLVLRTGVSKKTNKPYKGWYCSESGHPVEWEKV